MRLTVLGTGTARPTAGTATSGLLVRSGATAALLDCGTGIAARLDHHLPADALTAVVLTHLHADHALDLAALRYQFPWAGGLPRRIPLHVPAGGRSAIAAMSTAIAERPGFIEEAFEINEFAAEDLIQVGELVVRTAPAQHYVNAASVVVTDPAGRRLVYAGDTGPTERLVDLARGAHLFVVEATLLTADEDDPVRGHLTGDEAIDIAGRAQAERTLLVHYPAERRAALAAASAADARGVEVALEGMTVIVSGSIGAAGGAVPGRGKSVLAVRR